MIKIGTLAELNVKPGDVVECVEWWGGYYNKGQNYPVVDGFGAPSLSIGTKDICGRWRIVSRAPEKPKLWRDMTPEEKGALLLAHHEGKVIEWTGHFGSEFDMDSTRGTPVWSATHAYRIKPKPKVETVTMYGSPSKHIQWCLEQCAIDTHRITFNLIDGEPDCTSIKMEKL